MQQISDLLEITRALRDDALMEHNMHVDRENAQRRKLLDLEGLVERSVVDREGSISQMEIAVDGAWSLWVLRQRAEIQREFARIRALKLISEDKAKIALAQFNAAAEIHENSCRTRKKRLSDNHQERFDEMSLLQSLAETSVVVAGRD